MTPITCIAIDDEPMALLVIESFCRRKGNMRLTTYCEPHLGLEAIRSQKPDLIFLDIHMNSISGLEIADVLPEGCCFIFTTAFADYALDGFNLDAVDYLLKPFAYERFETAVEKAMRRIESRNNAIPQVLVVKQEYNNVTIELKSIIYIEALGNYCKIHSTDGKRILSHATLKHIQSLLPESQFIRINRSYIISMSKVEKYTKTQIWLKNTSSPLSIGESYAAKVAEIFLDVSR